MDLALADLVCPDCRSYVHPFLDLCPGCGTARSSWYLAALADGPDDPSILDDVGLKRAIAEAEMSHSLLAHRSGAIGATTSGTGDGGASSTALDEAVDGLASSITYRGVGLPGAAEAMDVAMRAAGSGISLRDERGHVLLTVDPALLLAGTPAPRGTRRLARWSGLSFEGSVELRSPSIDGGGLLLTFRSPTGHQQVAVGNRRGLFANKARAEHYDSLARLLGALAAVAAEARWREIGADAYAVALGLRAVPESGRSPVAGSIGREATGDGSSARGLIRPGSGAPASARSARERLAELDDLRAANLVTEDEYERKRAEILDSL